MFIRARINYSFFPCEIAFLDGNFKHKTSLPVREFRYELPKKHTSILIETHASQTRAVTHATVIMSARRKIATCSWQQQQSRSTMFSSSSSLQHYVPTQPKVMQTRVCRGCRLWACARLSRGPVAGRTVRSQAVWQLGSLWLSFSLSFFRVRACMLNMKEMQVLVFEIFGLYLAFFIPIYPSIHSSVYIHKNMYIELSNVLEGTLLAGSSSCCICHKSASLRFIARFAVWQVGSLWAKTHEAGCIQDTWGRLHKHMKQASNAQKNVLRGPRDNKNTVRRGRENFITRQPPIGEKDDYGISKILLFYQHLS